MTSLPGHHHRLGDMTRLQLAFRRLTTSLWLLLVALTLTMTSPPPSTVFLLPPGGVSAMPQGNGYVEYQPQVKAVEEDLSSSSRADCPDVCSCYHTYTSRREIPGGLILHVDCSQRGLSDFPPDIPSGAHTLDMSGNKLINITSLPKLTNLRELNLADNWLRHIDNRWVFEYSPTLRVLRLSENRLRSIQHGSFSGLEHLEELDLSMNILTSMDTHALAGLSNLKILLLDRNQLYDFSRDWFMPLTSLISLHASHNHISVMERHVLDRLTHLQHLDLSQNALRLIHREALLGLANLKFLNLSSNGQLSPFPSPAFAQSSIPRLDILLADDTNMNRLPSYAVANLSVTELSISFMPRLRVVEKFAFFNCTRLHNLQLHDNPQLVYLHPQAFSSLPSLKRLHIHNNGLIVVPGQIVTLLPALSDLQLDHNPLHCDCNSYWLRRELEDHTPVTAPRPSRQRVSDTTDDSPPTTSSTTTSPPPRQPLPHHKPQPTTIIREPDRVACFFPPSPHTPPSTKPMMQLAFQYFSPTCRPSALPLFPPVINVTLGTDLTLECQGLGVPTPTISWLLPSGLDLNSSTVQNPQSQHATADHAPRFVVLDDSLLTIKNVRVSDTGMYGCSVSNTLGKDMTSVMVHVKNKPLDILGVEVGYDYITVALVGNIRRAELREFQIYYKDTTTTTAISSSTTTTNDNNKQPQPPLDSIKGQTLTSKKDYRVLRFTTHGSFHRLKIRQLRPHTEYRVCLVYKDAHLVSCKAWTTSNVLRVVHTHQGIVRVSKGQVIAAIVGSLASVVFLMALVAFVRRRRKSASGYSQDSSTSGSSRRDEKASIPMDGMLLSKTANPSLNSSRTALLSNSHL